MQLLARQRRLFLFITPLPNTGVGQGGRPLFQQRIRVGIIPGVVVHFVIRSAEPERVTVTVGVRGREHVEIVCITKFAIETYRVHAFEPVIAEGITAPRICIIKKGSLSNEEKELNCNSFRIITIKFHRE